MALRNYLVPLLILWLTACGGQPPRTITPDSTQLELLPERAPFFKPGDSVTLPEFDMLGVDADMRSFLDEGIGRGQNRYLRMHGLLKALLRSGPLHIEYENLKTQTASETFHSRVGNCMSYSNLVIALARELGLKAWYQEVEVPHNWERQGDTWLYNRHINVLIDTGRTGKQVVDFNMEQFDNEFTRKRISDEEALAQYHNNMGVHWLQKHKLDLSYLHLQKAISLDADAAYFWTNLGALYRRAEDDTRAEGAWLQAVRLHNEPSALSSLARHYTRIGDLDSALYYRQEVERFRRRNPYYLYDLAATAYAAGEFSKSRQLLLRAIRIRDDEGDFYRLLALSYAKLGDFDAAQHSMHSAADVVRDAGLREHYNHKQRLLAGMAASEP